MGSFKCTEVFRNKKGAAVPWSITVPWSSSPYDYILVINILQNQHIVIVQSLTCNGEVCCYRHMLLGEII